MPDTFKPWDRQPAFTADRLSIIATGLRDTRDDALETYEPLKGDTTWNLGCTKYQRSKFCVQEMAKSHQSWLSIVPEKSAHRCTFAVEGIPVRFFHQGDDDPPEKYTSSTEGEDRQHQMLFEVDGVPFVQTLFRLAIKDYSTGKVESVTLVEFDKTGAIINEYSIPFGAASSSAIPLQTKPVNLNAVELEPFESEHADEKIRNHENDDSTTGTK